MIDTDFRFDKNDIVRDFKDWIEKFQNDDEDNYEPSHAKEVEYSKLENLRKIQKIYKFALKNSIMNLRRVYIHDDKKFKEVKGKLETYISNKIRSTSSGSIYLKVDGLISFSGDKKEYEDWVVQDKRNQERLIRKIIEELNGFIEGKNSDETNKPILNDYIEEPIIIDSIISNEQVVEKYIMTLFSEGDVREYIVGIENDWQDEIDIFEENFAKKLRENFSVDIDSTMMMLAGFKVKYKAKLEEK